MSQQTHASGLQNFSRIDVKLFKCTNYKRKTHGSLKQTSEIKLQLDISNIIPYY